MPNLLEPPRPFTAVIADDLTLVSEGLAALCEGIPGCTVLGQSTDGEEVWAMIGRMRPDVALLDLQLSRMMTSEILRRSSQAQLPTRIVILSTRGERKAVMDSLRAGASGFVLKSSSARDLEEALKQVLCGSIYVSPSIELQRLVEEADDRGAPIDNLSAREHQVFILLVEGVRAKEIANRLALSPKTVDTYRASLMRKLDIHDVPGLVKYAIQQRVTYVD